MFYRRDFRPPMRGDDSTIAGLRDRVDALERTLCDWFQSHQSPSGVVISDEKLWTPTVTSATGTITSATVDDARYWVVGGIIFYRVQITIVDAGTGGGGLRFTLPMDARLAHVGCGREVSATGYGLVVTGSSSTKDRASISYYDNTSPIVTGNICLVQGSFVP